MYCVIVGDIIKSSEIKPDLRILLYNSAKSVFSSVNQKYEKAILTQFGIVRGDAFEGVLNEWHYAPDIIQDIIKGFYAISGTRVRISAVIGELTIISGDRNETDGPAFINAFKHLDTLKTNTNNHWLQLTFQTGTIVDPIIEGMIRLLIVLTEGWTDKQREIAWIYDSQKMLQKNVSEALGISRTNVNRQLKAAKYTEYKYAWDSLEIYLKNIKNLYINDRM